ncbi:DUF2721 domain-containing protein [Altericroceibacterium xinjiangense]|uniref:DUF2721 domain-containing protein n=1 Tax=Altericroceibacterium xinjiangense TaxID=762261 RepID=UPI000F7F8998|nr:DUF2721 domain-containing protein [Altericroceibacterium xinjiangense]
MKDAPVIAQTIQLALAPAFLMVAIGNFMNTLSSRLGRVVDRSRELQERHAGTEGSEHDAIVREIRMVDRRIHLIGRAILLLVLAGLGVGIVVMMLFVEEFAALNLKGMIASVFSGAIILLVSALLLFLREVRQATEALRIPETYLELERKL